MKKKNLIILVEGGIIVALCVVLSFIPLDTLNGAFDLSLGILPLGLYAIRRGFLSGVLAGFVWGVIRMFFAGANFLTIPQYLLDYPVAFMFIGFIGLMSVKIKTSLIEERNLSFILLVILSGGIGIFLRWTMHFISGATVWASYAPKDMNPFFYSFIYNVPSFIVNLIYFSILSITIIRIRREIVLVKGDV